MHKVNGHVRPIFAALSLSVAVGMASSAIAVEGNPRINQIGYLPTAQKVATYATSSNSPLSWELRQGSTMVASGTTQVRGFDQNSGENIHHIDFSNTSVTGGDLRLFVGGDQSYPFDINDNIFTGVAYDALKYFYHNRSGIEIKTEHTGGGLGSFGNDAKWSRPAGHLGQGANKGDFNVACWPGTCNYSLDVPYGWYDAGDHGKYVVNGGISVWKLANMYEAAKHLRGTDVRFADGTLNIPESGNGISDVLDEIKWQMKFMLAMQVPEGQALAGMAHHKMHDFGWTGIPTLPHEDSNERYLAPPTTAATYNLAATAAMCGRLFAGVDPAFSNQCLSVAERAWDAAQQHPNEIIAPGQFNNGGGEYGDPKLWADKIWAASELYITTGNSKYRGSIDLSAVTSADFNWQKTDVAGVLSLATVPTTHSQDLMLQARDKIVGFANERLSIVDSEGYLAPLTGAEYAWGSNNNMANILTVLGIAYDVTGNEAFAQAVGKGVNYLFGQNPLSRSYITGHGEFTSAQPHHRFWAGAKDASKPWAPPGSLAGGPNFGLEDDLSRGVLDGCQSKPMTCYIDDIGAWSTNEITINWNSALAWVTAFWDDYGNNGNQAPVVTITSPDENAQLLSGADVIVSANASDADGFVSRVTFFVDGIFAGDDFTAPYSLNLGVLADGLHTVSAEAEDDAALTANSTPVGFRVGEVPPQAPNAGFSVSKDGLTVTLDGSVSTDADGLIVDYTWDLGDGTLLQGVSITHTYAAPGDYPVTLTVEDDDALIDSETQTVSVSEAPAEIYECSVGGYDIWNNGAIVRDISVTNISDTSLNGWSVDLKGNVNVGLTDAWGASVTGANGQLTASGADVLAPNQSVVFTLHISHSGGFHTMTCDTGKKEPGGSFDQIFQAEDYALMSGVETETTTDTGGGLNVGWIDQWDWMVYAPITLPASGQYVVEYRVASNDGNGGIIQFEERGGSPVYGEVSVSNTGGWQNWVTVSHTVTLSAGVHEFAIAAKDGGFNLNWFRVKSVD